MRASRLRGLLAKMDGGGSGAAFKLGWLLDAGDVGMRAEIFAQGATQHAHAGAMNDADTRQTGEKGTVEILRQLVGSFIDGEADEIDLGWDG